MRIELDVASDALVSVTVFFVLLDWMEGDGEGDRRDDRGEATRRGGVGDAEAAETAGLRMGVGWLSVGSNTRALIPAKVGPFARG